MPSFDVILGRSIRQYKRIVVRAETGAAALEIAAEIGDRDRSGWEVEDDYDRLPVDVCSVDPAEEDDDTDAAPGRESEEEATR